MSYLLFFHCNSGLHERASMLRYTYIACLDIYLRADLQKKIFWIRDWHLEWISHFLRASYTALPAKPTLLLDYAVGTVEQNYLLNP